MDTAQILLVVVVVILTALLVVLGVQVYLILREIRQTIIRTNKILDDAEKITRSIAEPVSKISAFAESFRTGSMIFSVLRNLPFFQTKKHRREDEE